MTTYTQRKSRAKVAGTRLKRIMSSHKLLTRQKCKRGHPYRKYGVFNTCGYLRCRRCMTDAQLRYEKRKKDGQT